MDFVSTRHSPGSFRRGRAGWAASSNCAVWSRDWAAMAVEVTAACRTTSPPRWTWRCGRGAADADEADPQRGQLSRRGAPDLAAEYLAGTLPPTAQAALAGFLARYGFRGLAEIDLGRPRWREDPTPIMQPAKLHADH